MVLSVIFPHFTKYRCSLNQNNVFPAPLLSPSRHICTYLLPHALTLSRRRSLSVTHYRMLSFHICALLAHISEIAFTALNWMLVSLLVHIHEICLSLFYALGKLSKLFGLVGANDGGGHNSEKGLFSKQVTDKYKFFLISQKYQFGFILRRLFLFVLRRFSVNNTF